MSGHIVIAGGSGFIGRRLAAELAAANHPVTILSRRQIDDVGSVKFVRWTPVDTAAQSTELSQVLEGAAAVINLCGESIAGPRWSDARKRQLRDSRVLPTQALVDACNQCQSPPRQFLQASGVGYYGSGEKERLETSGRGQDFLAELAAAWEAPLQQLKTDRAILRFGVVLGRRGGALPQMLLPFRAFAGGPIGNGQQWLSWIHLDDAVAAIRHLLNRSGDDKDDEIFNITAPTPVRNHEFADAAASALRRPNWLPVPKSVLKLLLGEQATLVCDGQRALPQALLRSGFDFRYPTIEQALTDLLR